MIFEPKTLDLQKLYDEKQNIRKSWDASFVKEREMFANIIAGCIGNKIITDIVRIT